MENNTDGKAAQTIFKSRNAGSCIAAGYRLYTANFRRLLRRTWPVAVVYAVVSAVAGLQTALQLPRVVAGTLANANMDSATAVQLLLTMGQLTAGYVLLTLALAVFDSQGFSALSEHQQNGFISKAVKRLQIDIPMLWRTLKACFFLLIVFVVMSLVLVLVAWLLAKVLSPVVGTVAVGLTAVVLLVLSLPLYYTTTSYLLHSKTTFITETTGGYRTGLRHLGSILAVALVSELLALCLIQLTTLPANILTMANLQAQFGVLQGDPLGMPSYVPWLTFFVFIVAGFIQAYVYLSAIFPAYYLYGSINTQEQERKDFYNNRQQ